MQVEKLDAIRSMRLADLDAVVNVHRSSFDGFFLASLGPAFLGEFYRAALLDQFGIALVSQEAGRLSGFAVGTLQPGGFYGRLARNHWRRFLVGSLLTVSAKPQIGLGILRRLAVNRRNCYEAGEALLLSIAVEPARQGAGTGKRLIQEFLLAAKQRGACSVCLTTDELNNAAVNQFYLRTGFERLRSFVAPEGRRMNEYGITL